MRKKILAVLTILGLVLASVAVYGAQVYWSRSLTKTITVEGIDAEILKPDGVSYKDKVKATALVNDKVFITIYAENFVALFLNVSYTTDATGLNVLCSGQYVEIQYSAGTYNVVNVGSSFDSMGYHTVDKTKMWWKLPDVGVLGCYALQLTFTFDSELVTTPGSYDVDLLFQMGSV